MTILSILLNAQNNVIELQDKTRGRHEGVGRVKMEPSKAKQLWWRSVQIVKKNNEPFYFDYFHNYKLCEVILLVTTA